MRHISTSIAFALSTLLLVSICSAQQTSDDKQNNSKQGTSPIGIEGPVIGGDGTANYIPIWRTPNYLLSSVIYQASGGNVGIGTTSPVAKLDVNGGINSATIYQLGGSNVLSTGSPANGNLFVGVGAGASDMGGQDEDNTFSGYNAGYRNSTGGGFQNTFTGAFAGYSNTEGFENTFYGTGAGYNNNGSYNTFTGVSAGFYNTTGAYNAFTGYNAGSYSTTGVQNTFTGASAGQTNISGSYNTFTGSGAGTNNTTGSYNTFYGWSAGAFSTGNNNIYLGGPGCYSPCVEDSTIRIGGDLGGGWGPQTATYIAGIYGSTSPSGVPVYVNSSGQLGTAPSSLRFKEQVRDMGDSTNALMRLRPVTFLYKAEYAKGERTLQYGLIAEEVAKVYPDLVAYDNDGQPYTVRYQYITTMLLSEVQKQYHRAEAEAKVITAQEQKIDDLEQRLARLESLIPRIVAQK